MRSIPREVGTAFRVIKNDLDIRPMFHWKEDRVKGMFMFVKGILKKYKINKLEIPDVV